MGRYNDLNRAEKLMAAKNKLEAWRKLDAATKSANYKAARLGLKLNVGWQWGYIKPFGETGNFFWEARILAVPTAAPKAGIEENNNSLITNVRNAVLASANIVIEKPTTANTSIKRAKKIQFARVLCSVPKTQTKPAISRITGRPYTLVESDTASCAFGQGATTGTTEVVAKGLIQQSLKGLQPTERISFKPQGYVG